MFTPSAAIDVLVSPELSTPPDADQPLLPLSTLHAKLGEIVKRYACCHLQILAAEEVLGNGFDATRKSQHRGQTSTEELGAALLELGKALAELETVKWETPIFEPLQRSTISDVGKVLQDLDSFAGKVDKALRVFEVSRFPCGTRLGCDPADRPSSPRRHVPAACLQETRKDSQRCEDIGDWGR
jgi:hypothetical protein